MPDYSSLSEINGEIAELLEEVWDYLGEYHAYQLSDMTHVEFPWKKARRGLPKDAASTEVIPLEDLRLLGQQKLEEVERENPVYSASLAYLLKHSFGEDLRKSEYIKQGEVHDWLTSLLASENG